MKNRSKTINAITGHTACEKYKKYSFKKVDPRKTFIYSVNCCLFKSIKTVYGFNLMEILGRVLTLKIGSFLSI